MANPTFTAGRDIKGAFATGTNSSAVATMSESVTPAGNVDITAAIAALHDIMRSLPDLEPRALTRLNEAREEANKPIPKRDEVKSLIAQATMYAREVSGFAEVTEKLKPHLQAIAAWLGSTDPFDD